MHCHIMKLKPLFEPGSSRGTQNIKKWIVKQEYARSVSKLSVCCIFVIRVNQLADESQSTLSFIALLALIELTLFLNLEIIYT